MNNHVSDQTPRCPQCGAPNPFGTPCQAHRAKAPLFRDNYGRGDALADLMSHALAQALGRAGG